jgi:flagellin FlaB
VAEALQRRAAGVTGLETAIILIAFVVVASVFAYRVLSAGIFSWEKGKEAVHAGLEQARSSMVILGLVVAKDTNDDGNVDEIVFIVSNSLEGAAINLTTTTDSDSDGVLSDESTKVHSTIVSYVDQVQEVTDLAWTQSEIGKGDGDSLLEPNEKFEVTIDISQFSTRLGADDEFTLEMKPEQGSSLVIQRRRLR